jgi:hypothetical protein
MHGTTEQLFHNQTTKEKNTMSADVTPHEPSPTSECGDGLKMVNGECVPITDEDVVGSAGAADAQKGGLFAATKAIFEEVLDQKMAEMEQKITTRMNQTVEDLQKEFAVGLRKSLGLSTDPTVTKQELDGAIRKAVLGLKLGGKRTPAGTNTPPPLQKTERPGDIFASYRGN